MARLNRLFITDRAGQLLWAEFDNSGAVTRARTTTGDYGAGEYTPDGVC